VGLLDLPVFVSLVQVILVAAFISDLVDLLLLDVLVEDLFVDLVRVILVVQVSFNLVRVTPVVQAFVILALVDLVFPEDLLVVSSYSIVFLDQALLQVQNHRQCLQKYQDLSKGPSMSSLMCLKLLRELFFFQ